MKRDKLIIVILSAIVAVETTLLIFALPKKPRKAVSITRAAIKGKIAIVLDDWGYHQDTMGIVKKINYPMTMSVLPNLPHTTAVARNLYDLGFEIILHLPSQPHEQIPLEENTILTGMDPDQIKGIIDKDLLSVGFCKGVSNHMGSKLTEDPKTMGVIFTEMKKRNLYFLDSFVTARSICKDTAKKTNVKFAKRDIFLDNEDDPAYIKNQIYKLKIKARRQGQAIGIGHDRPNTLKALKETLPGLVKEGYKLVFVSELVK